MKDQEKLESLLAKGIITQEELKRLPGGNRLLRCIRRNGKL